MKSFKQIVNETSLSRVWRHQNDFEIPFALLTAYRGEYTAKQNKARNKKLEAQVRKAGYGFFKLEGVWIENEGTPEEQRVVEESLFVIGGKDDGGRLKGLVKGWVKEYNQDAALFRPEDNKGNAILIFKNGKEEKLGKLSVNKTGQAYSKLRNKNATFVFEHAYFPKNWIDVVIEGNENGKSD